MTENIRATICTHYFSNFKSFCDLRFYIRIENHYSFGFKFWYELYFKFTRFSTIQLYHDVHIEKQGIQVFLLPT